MKRASNSSPTRSGPGFNASNPALDPDSFDRFFAAMSPLVALWFAMTTWHKLGPVLGDIGGPVGMWPSRHMDLTNTTSGDITGIQRVRLIVGEL